MSCDFKNRKQIRLTGYDYSQNGAYFVTICTQNRECLFGNVVDGQMILDDAGKMVDYWWCELSHHFDNIELGQHTIMPNHIHGIICIVGADRCVGPRKMATDTSGGHIGPPLPQMVQWYKTMTTNQYIHNVKNCNWRPFEKRLWQRNYYEQVIRTENDYNRISEYIINNPVAWEDDDENPCRDRPVCRPVGK